MKRPRGTAGRLKRFPPTIFPHCCRVGPSPLYGAQGNRIAPKVGGRGSRRAQSLWETPARREPRPPEAYGWSFGFAASDINHKIRAVAALDIMSCAGC